LIYRSKRNWARSYGFRDVRRPEILWPDVRELNAETVRFSMDTRR